jgi:hypothetical protein
MYGDDSSDFRLSSFRLTRVMASCMSFKTRSNAQRASAVQWKPELWLPAGGVLVALLVLVGRVPPCPAANEEEVATVMVTPARPHQPVSLRDRLIVGLQARLKSEVAFVDNVAFRVRVGQIPQRVVDQTFFWARDRASAFRSGKTRRPIIYFQPAMTARAKRLGVTL